jgi:hypothetical protein
LETATSKILQLNLFDEKIMKLKLLLLLLCAINGVEVYAQAANSDLALFDIAKSLANPFANQTRIPITWSEVRGRGINQTGSTQSIQIEPLIPIELGDVANLTLRPSMSFISNNNVNGFSGTGVGGMQLQTYFSPKYRKSDPEYWGIGPYISAPAGTTGNFGSQQTGLGVSAGYAREIGPWNLGLLVVQSWSAGGNPKSGTVNFIDSAPFISYTTESAWSYSTFFQSTYNYDSHSTANIASANLSKTVRIENMPITFSIGPQYSVRPVLGGPHGWGMNFGLNFTL